MKAYWTINGHGRYQSMPVAQRHAERKFPAVVWGNPHQGPSGRIRVVGKLGDADDPVVIEQHKGR